MGGAGRHNPSNRGFGADATAEAAPLSALDIASGAEGPRLRLHRAYPPHPHPSHPMLFLHGFTAGAWMFAEHWMPALASRGHTSFALDLRGHGESDGRETLRKARLNDYRADVRRAVSAIEAETGRTPVLIGHSLGSVLARLQAAERAPAGLGLLGFGELKSSMSSFMRWMLRRYPLATVLGMATGRPGALWARFDPQYRVMFDGQDRNTVAPYVARLQKQPDSDRIFMDLMKVRPAALLAPVPVLVAVGENDPIAKPESVRNLAAAYGTEPVFIEGAAHDLMVGSSRDRALKVISCWLDELPNT